MFSLLVVPYPFNSSLNVCVAFFSALLRQNAEYPDVCRHKVLQWVREVVRLYLLTRVCFGRIACLTIWRGTPRGVPFSKYQTAHFMISSLPVTTYSAKLFPDVIICVYLKISILLYIKLYNIVNCLSMFFCLNLRKNPQQKTVFAADFLPVILMNSAC